jgi:hypothetical protein
VLTSSDPASNTTLVNSDYQRAGEIGSAKQSDTSITTANISTSAYNNWPMNSTGLASVNPTGITKLKCKVSPT